MNKEIEVLARTIYGEARGEYHKKEGGLAALIAVGNVILNRLKQKTWFGKSVSEVCLKAWQFSCWNDTDPNSTVLKQAIITEPVFKVCQEVAQGLILKEWPDLTKGSDHYHHRLMHKLPMWAKDKHPQFQVGHHLFYKLGK